MPQNPPLALVETELVLAFHHMEELLSVTDEAMWSSEVRLI